MVVIVPNDQLSLAIGKRGQNVRLAAKLTHWKIDIKSENEADGSDSERQEALRRAEMAFLPARPQAAPLDSPDKHETGDLTANPSGDHESPSASFTSESQPSSSEAENDAQVMQSGSSPELPQTHDASEADESRP